MAVLAPDVTFIGDSGGKVRAARRPLHGADKVARLFAAIALGIPAGTTIDYRDVNGGPAAVAVLNGVPYAVFVIDVNPDTGLIAAVHVMGNPDKLATLTNQSSWTR